MGGGGGGYLRCGLVCWRGCGVFCLEWSEMQAGVAGFPYAGVVENQQV
jgi:hypothetical protein